MTEVGNAVGELRRSVVDRTEPELSLFMTGVVSVRLPDDLIGLKPSAVSADELSTSSIVVTDLSGQLLDGVLAPAAGGDAHAYVYRNVPEVRGIVNIRSTLALAWAGRGESIPRLPGMAHGFEGPTPVGPAVSSTGEAIGRGIVDTLLASGSPAVLMRGQGLFTTGPNPGEAVRLAAQLEQTMRTVHIARHLGTAEPLDPHATDWLRNRGTQ
ncbi:class II aldolase/adducin family protein [Kribbella sp. NPDC051952]|uniref:class II aldolase/adducin family protein n=1 Tax=Kribbella sp. NPDC051952 TaxID=3154851 RepID=UPI0034406D03